MDFLNQAFAQMGDMFRSMTPGARLTSGLLMLLVVISLGYLFTQQVSSGDAYLMNGEPISASQLPAMEAAFSKAGLNNYTIDGTKIRVPNGQQAAYMGALADAKALPPNFSIYLDDALDNSNAFESRAQREQRINVAKQKELARILCNINGIENAAVLYDVETKRGLNQTMLKTASVSIKPLGSQNLDSQQVSSIRHTVSAAYAGLKPDNVTVTDLNGRTYPGGADDGDTGPTSDRLGIAKQQQEIQWQSKIQKLLAYVHGAIVTTNVELDNKRVSHSDAVEYGTKAVPLSTSEESTSMTHEGSPSAGAPGYIANAANAPGALGVARKGSSESADESKTDSRSVVDTTHTVTEDFPFTTRMVKVSVAVPSSYLKQIWQKSNPVEEGAEPTEPDQAALDTIREEEIARITSCVAPLLPKPTSGALAPTDLVTVNVFQDISGEAIPEPGVTDNAMAWFAQSWSMLGMVGLAMFSLMMLRSMVRGTTVAMAPQRAEGPAGENEPIPEENTVQPSQRLGKFSGSGPTLRDELSELVQEDPDSAANILRTWIGQTG
jgi:flagellar M-ring protein FliF